MQRGREGDRERGRHGITVSWQALIISLPTAVSGSLFFALRSPGVYAWGGGPKHPFSFPVFPLQGTLCVQSPEERPLKGPKEKGKEFFCCPCDPAVNGWATERRKGHVLLAFGNLTIKAHTIVTTPAHTRQTGHSTKEGRETKIAPIRSPPHCFGLPGG